MAEEEEAIGILRLLPMPKVLNLSFGHARDRRSSVRTSKRAAVVANFLLRSGDRLQSFDFSPHAATAMAVLGLPSESKCMMSFVSNRLLSPTQKAAWHMTFVATADPWHRFPIH